MEIIDVLKDFQLWGNSGWDYSIFLGWFVGLMISFKLFKVVVIARLNYLSRKTKSDIDDFAIRMINELKPPFYLLVALYIAIRPLDFNELVDKIVYGLFITVLIFQAVLVAQKIIDYILEKKILKNVEGVDDAKNKKAAIKLLSQIFKVALWVIGLLMILSNLGVDVTSLVAGLGVGGIAIAFALQGILGDLFASFSIFLDQPFKVGDYVQAGTESGTVKKVGVKTSRIQTLNGEELVVANTDIASARIRNFSKMEKRRVKFNLGVIYGTKSKQLKEIPEMIKKIIQQENDAEFGRVKFTTFGDSALIFEVLYHIKSSDIDLYLDIQERVNLAIYEEFEKKKIEFAFPSQTIYVSKS
jgi:small-conductance mechanosensitive channel